MALTNGCLSEGEGERERGGVATGREGEASLKDSPLKIHYTWTEGKKGGKKERKNGGKKRRVNEGREEGGKKGRK